MENGTHKMVLGGEERGGIVKLNTPRNIRGNISVQRLGFDHTYKESCMGMNPTRNEKLHAWE